MARYDAMDETFEEITVCGKPALFTCLRIQRDTVPKGLYLYEVRHDDDNQGDPVQIAKVIWVNHFGSIITATPIPQAETQCIDIDPIEDWNFAGEGDCRTVDEFLRSYSKSDAEVPDE